MAHDDDDIVTWCRSVPGWSKRKWLAGPALIHRSGSRASAYYGQSYDASKIRLDPKGWTHDHCLICYQDLYESDDPKEGEGYTCDGSAWVCTECYERKVLGGPNVAS
jgi:hypothetical protein